MSPLPRPSCTGTVLSCPRCGAQHRKTYVPADFLNDARETLRKVRDALTTADGGHRPGTAIACTLIDTYMSDHR